MKNLLGNSLYLHFKNDRNIILKSFANVSPGSWLLALYPWPRLTGLFLSAFASYLLLLPLLLAPASWPLPPGPCLLAPASWPLPPVSCLLATASWPLPPGPCLLAPASWPLPPGPCLLALAISPCLLATDPWLLLLAPGV